MRTKAILFVTIAFYLFGCKSPTDSTQSQDPFSLQKAWIYSYQTFDLNGPTGDPTTDSVYVLSTSPHNGKTLYALSNANSILVDSSGMMTGYCQTDCICEADKIPAVLSDTVFRTNIPMKVNGNVTYGTLKIFVSNADTTITVPAGTFRCAVYELEIFANNLPAGAPGFSYISPSVGLIETESYSIDPRTGKTFLQSRKQLVRTVK